VAPRARPVRRRRDDSGHVAVEFLGAVPYLVLGVLAVLQLTFAVSTMQATSTAARAAARAVSQTGGGDADRAARQAVPSWLQDKLSVTVTGGLQPGVTVSAPIPVVLPVFDGPTVSRSAWFDPEHGRTPWG
jgi:Flp pilus assembly protein TadG